MYNCNKSRAVLGPAFSLPPCPCLCLCPCLCPCLCLSLADAPHPALSVLACRRQLAGQQRRRGRRLPAGAHQAQARTQVEQARLARLRSRVGARVWTLVAGARCGQPPGPVGHRLWRRRRRRRADPNDRSDGRPGGSAPNALHRRCPDRRGGQRRVPAQAGALRQTFGRARRAGVRSGGRRAGVLSGVWVGGHTFGRAGGRAGGGRAYVRASGGWAG